MMKVLGYWNPEIGYYERNGKYILCEDEVEILLGGYPEVVEIELFASRPETTEVVVEIYHHKELGYCLKYPGDDDFQDDMALYNQAINLLNEFRKIENITDETFYATIRGVEK